jgi:hypothetical protein
MKLNRIITLCAMASALGLSGNALAQDNGNDNGGGGGQQRARQGGRNFDPQQMIQRRLDDTRDTLGFTNDTEWDAVKPLVQKVLEAQRDVMISRMGGMMGRNRGGDRGPGGPGGPGGFGQQASPEQTALQKAVDDNAPSAQIKDLMAKYSAAQKAKQAKLEAAQGDLRKVLNTKQEAQATLARLLD